MFLKSLAHGFKCSCCCKHHFLLTPFGRFVLCPKCAPRYDTLITSLFNIEKSLVSAFNNIKEVL